MSFNASSRESRRLPVPVRPQGPRCRVEGLEQRVLFAATPALGGFVDEQVVTGLTAPTAMEFAPDGRLFVTQQGGALRVIKNGVLLTTPFTSLTVDSSGERGPLGIAFDPNYATNRFVYVYYTATTPTTHNRVSRFTADAANPDLAVGGSEVPILDLENLSATNHNGGAIHFGTDGKLYVAVGDNAVRANSQVLTNRLGKMLRINPDGTIPSDNPFFTTASGANRAIWARGLRNPYTFAVQPGTGLTYINDVGEQTWEEVNVGSAAANYGWGHTQNIEGPIGSQTPPANYVNPLHAYQHPPVSGVSPNELGIAISGGAFYNPTTTHYPIGYTGDYFFADLGSGSGGRWIRKLEAGTGNSSLFATGLSSPVDLKTGPEGKLYYLERGSNGRVGRIAAVTPAVQSVQINNGHAQRSMIKSVTVTFTRPVTIDLGAITLTGRNGALDGVTANVSPTSGANLSYVMTFHSPAGGPVVGGSLPDGIFDLRIDAAKVHDSAVPAQTLAANFARAFHRLYSDIDGDGDSDNADLFQFRGTYLKPNTDPAFLTFCDYENDGDVDNADIFQIRSRRAVEFKGY